MPGCTELWRQKYVLFTAYYITGSHPNLSIPYLGKPEFLTLPV